MLSAKRLMMEFRNVNVTNSQQIEDVGCASNSEGAVTNAEVKRNNDVQRRILC